MRKRLEVKQYLVKVKVHWAGNESSFYQTNWLIEARTPSLAARYLEKKTRRFLIFFALPPFCFPGFTRG